MQLLNDLWNNVLKEPVTAILMSVAVAYAVALGNKLVAGLGLKNEALIRDALHKAAENGVNMAVSRISTGVNNLSGQAFDAVVLDAADYVKQRNPGAIKKLGVTDAGLKDIIKSKIGKDRK